MGVFNFWLIVAGAVLTSFTMERLSGAPRLVFALALAGFGLCLAVGHVLRAGDWVTASEPAKEDPVGGAGFGPQAHRAGRGIILVNPREVNGALVFAAAWDINNAIPWAYPFLRQNFPQRLTALTLAEVTADARKYAEAARSSSITRLKVR